MRPAVNGPRSSSPDLGFHARLLTAPPPWGSAKPPPQAINGRPSGATRISSCSPGGAAVNSLGRVREPQVFVRLCATPGVEPRADPTRTAPAYLTPAHLATRAAPLDNLPVPADPAPECDPMTPQQFIAK